MLIFQGHVLLFDTAHLYWILDTRYIICMTKDGACLSSRRSLKFVLTNAYKLRSDPKKVSCPKTVAVLRAVCSDIIGVE